MTELEKKLISALLMIRDHINEPEVITSIIDKNIGTDKDVLLDDPAGEAVLGKLTPDNTEELSKDDHFGEEQAAGLTEILKGLTEGPNDNRW